MSYTVVGVSSGGGVSLYPFRDQVLVNVEARAIFHTPKQIQWHLNFPNVPLVKKLPEGKEKADVLISSPDCGSGSILRMSRAKEYGDHKENKSLDLFFEGIIHYQPRLFLFENLEGLFKSFPEAEFDAALSGYSLVKHVAPVSMWGNSQVNRERLIIVGIRRDQPGGYERYFRLPDLRHRNLTCRELYGDLDNLTSITRGHVRESLTDTITIYAGKKLKISEIREIWNDNPDKKRWEWCPGKRFSTAPGVYRNKAKDYPATARKANRQFDHQGLMLTPRQLARIQGVPDEFEIYVDPDKLNFWINKGRALVTKTPPMEISKWFKRKIDKLWL